MADLFNVDLDYIMGRSDKITVLPERLDYENRISKNTKWCKSGANEHKKEPPSRAADILSGTLR
jgi:hypothetical protein